MAGAQHHQQRQQQKTTFELTSKKNELNAHVNSEFSSTNHTTTYNK